MTATYSYVARYRDCGCMYAAIVDDQRWRKDIAKTTAQWYSKGAIVERVDNEIVRQQLLRCPHPHRKEAK